MQISPINFYRYLTKTCIGDYTYTMPGFTLTEYIYEGKWQFDQDLYDTATLSSLFATNTWVHFYHTIRLDGTPKTFTRLGGLVGS